ncbi:MAG: 16S rRNA (adenine(1518)-N(6)/adenine(1519)-N(6))-dimethyltransferase RsmA [bacterium]
MNLHAKKTITDLFKKHTTSPLKQFGQNFLVNKGVLAKIIVAAEITDQDTIIEVGPGLGVLTQELAQKAKKIVAVEKSREMIEILEETLKGFKNIEIIREDILKLGIENYGKYKVVANLPYYITSPTIRKFLEAKNQPQKMVLMVQKEVAQRICAKPPEMSLLAVAVQFYGRPKIISRVSRGSFWPIPKVDSAILEIIPHPGATTDSQQFFKIVKAGFAYPRKQLINNLSRGANKETVEKWLEQNDINPSQRAETLSLEDWLNLTKNQTEN